MKTRASFIKPSVFQFTDAQSFLKAYVQARRAHHPQWSLGMWARQLGLAGTATLTNLLQGRRTPGDKLQLKLVAYFGFNAKEESYFRDLIRLKRVQSDPVLSISVMEKLSKQHPSRQFRMLDDRTFQSIADWRHYAIREMIARPDFEEDPEKLARALRGDCKPSEIKKVIENLESLKLLKRDENGRLRQSEAETHTSDDIANEAIKRFHESMIEQAKRSLREIEVELRDISACTFNLNPEKLPEIKRAIRDFRFQLDSLFTENSSKAQTYQLNLQLFPLTQEQSS